MTILAADIGGTKTVVALFESHESRLENLAEATFDSRAHASLEEILDQFLEAHRDVKLKAACFGVAGAVIQGKSDLTHLPWILDETKLARVLGTPRAVLINDLEAATYGIMALGSDELAVLNPGAQGAAGSIAVIAAGTGLGEAFLGWDGERHHVHASEGGQVGFAPRGDEQIELLRFLRLQFGERISTERVLSGPGLHNIYRFVRQCSQEEEPPWLSQRIAQEDPSAVISELALGSQDACCAHSLKIFVSIYGAVAGDIALSYLATGGIFIGGGIAPKILPALETDTFMQAFTDKGHFSELLAGIPVSVALEPRAPLLGAARHALSL
jgi:glucokinase